MIQRIISGGQTGVDRAALDAAIACGVPHGGWLPAGRKTEAGRLPSRYELVEMATSSYPRRTEKNVSEADATLLLSRGSLGGGSALTMKYAQSYGKPCLHVDLQKNSAEDAFSHVTVWLDAVRPKVLNVAGPRASSDGMVYAMAYCLMVKILKRQALFLAQGLKAKVLDP